MAICSRLSLVGASPATCLPLSSSLERLAGSSRPKEILVGVISQPPSIRMERLPALPKESPRSNIERPNAARLSRALVSSLISKGSFKGVQCLHEEVFRAEITRLQRQCQLR